MRCCPDKNKVIARNYLKKAGFYSYDAAADDEDPVKRWIGRDGGAAMAAPIRHNTHTLRSANNTHEQTTEQ